MKMNPETEVALDEMDWHRTHAELLAIERAKHARLAGARVTVTIERTDGFRSELGAICRGEQAADDTILKALMGCARLSACGFCDQEDAR